MRVKAMILRTQPATRVKPIILPPAAPVTALPSRTIAPWIP